MISDKTSFFNDLSTHILEPIYLTNEINELKKEIHYNHWSISAPIDILHQTTATDLLQFIQKVKNNYQNQLNQSQLEVDLIFYLWFDEMAGHLCFNFINSNHDKLPFGCEINYAESPEEIINQYLKSAYLDGIVPWDELGTIDSTEKTVQENKFEEDIQDNFILTVYQERIEQQK